MKSRKEWEDWNRQRLSKAKAKLATAQSQLTTIQSQLDDPDYFYGKYSKKSAKNLKAIPVPEVEETFEDDL
jgi:multidrug resistance efflux pump